MKINNIRTYSYTANKYYQNQPTQMTANMTKPTFGSDFDDKRTANEFYKQFAKITTIDTDETIEDLKKKSKEFFDAIEKQPDKVKNKFLLMRNGDQESTFNLSLYSNDISSALNIIKMFKKADEDIRFQLLVPKVRTMGSPFFTAVDYDSTLQIAQELRKMVKTLTPEHQGEFYYHKLSNLFGSNTDVIEELRDSGCNLFAQELLADKNKYAKKYPELAKKYEKKYNKADKPEGNFENIRPKEEEKPTPEKISNFRVYENVKTTFDDVGGLFNVKKQIKEELLNILNNPKVKIADKPSGIILYGPPGTGKTLLATAIAGEAKVPLISANGSSFNEIYVGAGAKHVRELYALARNLAAKNENKTAIIFIDEADAVAAKRESANNTESNHTLNALLGEMDGVQTKEENEIKVITILATNRRDLFDEAFRKGRIDFEFKIDDPRFSEKARREILEINAKDKPFKDEETKKKLLDDLAKTSSGLSGAELADIIKKAYRKTLYLGRKIEYITPKDINEAKLESLIGIKNDSEKSDFEQRSVIAHEAGHAINQIIMNNVFANEYHKSKLPIQKVDFIVNESRGDAAGLTLMKPSDNSRLTVESLLSTLVVNYGGYSIEEEMFDGHTDGVSGDLESSTNLILKSVTKWGLGSKTKYIGCTPNGYSYELFKPDIKNDIVEYSNKAMMISSDISKFVKPFIEEYVNTFFDAEKENKASIITGEKFEEMFNEWLKKNGNQRDYQALCEEIRENITLFKTKINSKN